MDMKIKALVVLLGEPEKKHGGHSPISLEWKNHEKFEKKSIQAEFVGSMWEDQENQLSSIIFFSNEDTA